MKAWKKGKRKGAGVKLLVLRQALQMEIGLITDVGEMRAVHQDLIGLPGLFSFPMTVYSRK